MRIVAISDTHRAWHPNQIPDGDVLIHAGDFTSIGSLSEVIRFNKLCKQLKHPHKLLIPGNHERCMDSRQGNWYQDESWDRLDQWRTLCDERVDIDGISFYGTPYQEPFCEWAFAINNSDRLRQKWKQVPVGIDVLITHAPPYGILDGDEHYGIQSLREEVFGHIRPRVHIFGHIHEGHGQHEEEGISFYNACINDDRYQCKNRAWVIDIESKGQ